MADQLGAAELKLRRLEATSIVTLVYSRLRALILDGRFVPGERLGQAELAEGFGVSRTPVREALRRLVGEGLVEIEDQRGSRVAHVELGDVARLLEVRLVLEPGIARLAAQRRTSPDLEALTQAIAEQRRARTAPAIHDASRAFHLALANATHNRDLVATIERLWPVDIGRRLLSQRTAAARWQTVDVDEHARIAAAVRRGASEEAADLIASHVCDALAHWEPTPEGAG